MRTEINFEIMASNLNKELTILLEFGFVQLESEWETIEITQRLRKNGCNMIKVKIDLEKFRIWIKNTE